MYNLATPCPSKLIITQVNYPAPLKNGIDFVVDPHFYSRLSHIISECQLKICSQQIVLKFMVLELQCEASLSMANLCVQFCLRAKKGGGVPGAKC